MQIRAFLFPIMLAMLAGCAVVLDRGPDASDVSNPQVDPPAECRAEGYAFAGRGTFAELGLVGQSKAELPQPNRPAMIWVTSDPVPFDAAAPGGSRMLCFEFDDGSGGTEWPVNEAWQPPAAAETDLPVAVNPTFPWPVAVVAVLVVGGTLLAFRRR